MAIWSFWGSIMTYGEKGLEVSSLYDFKVSDWYLGFS